MLRHNSAATDMARRPEIGNVQVYPNRPLNDSDKNGYVLKFYCPIRQTRVRRNCGTRDRREARRIQRECRERLLNGMYVESGGAITAIQGQTRYAISPVLNGSECELDKNWTDCVELYCEKCRSRMRETSYADATSRFNIAGRILEGHREDLGLPSDETIADFVTLEAMEYLQERLLAGDEGRFDYRAPMTVNTMMGAVMAFLRFCHVRGWIHTMPPLSKLSVDEVMKGRPVTIDEFEQMIEATPDVVGERATESWQRVLFVLWESAFRVGDVMNFSWDDDRCIRPIWPVREGQFPTLAIPSSQKNKKTEEIPMLPGLQSLLESTPKKERHGWVVNPLPIDYQIRSQAEWFKPTNRDLAAFVERYSNSAIARACGVTETTVRQWSKTAKLNRKAEFNRHQGEISDAEIIKLRKRSQRSETHAAQRHNRRLTKERVSRIISQIGEAAGIVVQQADSDANRRVKYASAHDIRRGCAQRLINAGVSAETLKVVLRHRDFDTTERFYGATREAQSAASEINEKLASLRTKNELVGGLVGGEQKKLLSFRLRSFIS